MVDIFKSYAKINAWLNKILAKIKKWFLKTAVPWIKISWMQIVNMIILYIAYKGLKDDQFVQGITGFWLFVLIGYYLFWKLLGFEKIWKNRKK